MHDRSCSRRQLLAIAALASAGGVALPACAAGATASATPATSPAATATGETSKAAGTRGSAIATAVPARSTAQQTLSPVVYMQTFQPAEQARLRQIFLPDVKRDLPDISLQIVPAKPNYTDLQILIAANSQPDVAMCQGFNPLGMFEDPTAFIAREHFDLRPYNAAMLQSWRWQGTLWCLPVSVGGNGPIWAFNKTRFDNAGVPSRPTAGTTRPGPGKS